MKRLGIESWFLLLSLEFPMRFSGVGALHGIVRGQRLHSPAVPQRPSCETLLGDHLKTGHLWSLQNRPLWMV
jgi:hypothetical protein